MADQVHAQLEVISGRDARLGLRRFFYARTVAAIDESSDPNGGVLDPRRE
jgi:hypothetical protein